MSIISQIAVVLLIVLTGGIILYASRSLENAAKEGEQFVDEWAMRQVIKEEKRKKYTAIPEEIPDKQAENLSDIEAEDPSDIPPEYVWDRPSDHPSEDDADNRPDNLVLLRPKRTKNVELMLLDSRKNVERAVTVTHFPFSIGRDSKNDFRLDDLYVARFHCQILEEKGQIVVRDLGTANKIYAQGRTLEELVLADQDSFYLGGCEFRVGIQEKRSEATRLASGAERS